METQEPELAPGGPLRARDSASPTPARPSLMTRVFVGPQGIRSGWRVALWLLVTSAAASALGIVVLIVLRRFPPQDSPSFFIVGDGIGLGGALAATVLMARIERRRFADYALPLGQAFGRRFLQGAAWGLTSVTVLLGAIHLGRGFEFGTVALRGTAMARYGLLWAAAFLVVGTFEEVFTRAYALFTLGEGVGFWPAAAILSAAFGALHLGNHGESRVGALAAAVIGLFFCLTVRRTGSLWFAIGMHFGWDYAESFIYSVPDSGNLAVGHLLNSSFHGPRWLTGGSVGPEGSVLVFVLMGILFVLFDRFHREVRFPLPPSPPPPDAPGTGASPLGLSH
ncbi:MAG TPA: CPBP family intramembrane glutamic endopeptidase [Terriglobia bacterium]|nr:CPBP family intramembrane glutamic endopeptidase [Terriglobia bacterium]